MRELTRRRRVHLRRPPRGVALVVALMMLVVILVLGLTALRLSTAQERMTGYTLDRQLAFQAAEAALREIEERVENERPDAGANCTDSATAAADTLRVCPALAASAAARWVGINAAQWGQAKPVGPAGAQITPTYLIEHLGNEFACDASTSATSNCRQYRITVRAGGGTRAEVMLQSLYLTD
jgi:type IV pilus assembly protein PilX